MKMSSFPVFSSVFLGICLQTLSQKNIKALTATLPVLWPRKTVFLALSFKEGEIKIESEFQNWYEY